ncbi:MAG: class D sortase [Clostridia bacterium]|nr:class D sortase [Clostridia bacterium]
MKKLYKVLRSVAMVIAPLILSITVVLGLYLFLGKTLSPFVSVINLFLSHGEQVNVEQEFDNIFEGYTGEGEEEVVDGNTLQFPTRGALYAKLAIDSCFLETDVYFDDSDEALSRGGVGQHYATKIPGCGTPILICGHSIGKFSALQYVKVGDIVTMTTNYGIYEYQVREIAIKDMDDPTAADLTQEKEELILYTCYPFTNLRLTRERYFVYADKISGPEIVY